MECDHRRGLVVASIRLNVRITGAQWTSGAVTFRKDMTGTHVDHPVAPQAIAATLGRMFARGSIRYVGGAPASELTQLRGFAA